MLALIFALTVLRLAAVSNALSLNFAVRIKITASLGTVAFILLTKRKLKDAKNDIGSFFHLHDVGM